MSALLRVIARNEGLKSAVVKGLEYLKHLPDSLADNAEAKSDLIHTVVDYLQQYVAQSLEMRLDGDIDSVVDLTAQVSLAIGEMDLLFVDLFRQFSQCNMAGRYFVQLTPAVIKHSVVVSSPEFFQSLFSELLVSCNDLDLVEDLVLSVNPRIMDLDMVCKATRRLNLLKSFAYVCTAGLLDYLTPIVEYVKLVGDFNTSSASIDGRLRKYVHDVFVLIAFMLDSCAFPTAEHVDVGFQAKNDVIQYLFTPSTSSSLQLPISILMEFDAAESMRLLLHLFRYFYGEDIYRDTTNPVSMQSVFDDILQLGKSNDFNLNVRMYTCSFLLKVGRLYPGCVKMTDDDFQFLIFFLVETFMSAEAGESGMGRKELEYVLIYADIDKRMGPNRQQDLLTHCETAGLFFFRACRCWRHGDVVMAFKELIQSDDHSHVIEYLECVLSNPMKIPAFVKDFPNGVFGLEKEQKDMIFNSILHNSADLMRIDGLNTVEIVLRNFGDSRTLFEESLRSYPKMLYSYLAILSAHDSLTLSSALHNEYIELMCEFEPEAVLSYLKNTDSEFDAERARKCCKRYGVADAYVWLCLRAHDYDLGLEFVTSKARQAFSHILGPLVSSFVVVPDGLQELISVKSTIISEYLQLAIATCREAHSGASDESQDILWYRLLDTFVDMQRELVNTVPDIPQTPISAVPKSARAPASNSELLLERVNDNFKHYIQTIFYALMSYTSDIIAVVEKIINDPRMSTKSLRNFREILISIFGVHSQEKNSLATALRAVKWDIRDLMYKRMHSTCKASSIHDVLICQICRSVVDVHGGCCGIYISGHDSYNPESVIVMSHDGKIGYGAWNEGPFVIIFSCLHAFHGGCLNLDESDYSISCSQCTSTPLPPDSKGKARESSNISNDDYKNFVKSALFDTQLNFYAKSNLDHGQNWKLIND